MYCFNTNCNRWGEHASSGGVLLWWPGNFTGTCDECGGVTVVHDNWDRDERTHDDGTKVVA